MKSNDKKAKAFKQKRLKKLQSPKGNFSKQVNLATGAKAVTNQLEGGEELEDATLIAYEGASIGKGITSKGRDAVREAKIAEKKLRLKIVDAKKKKVVKQAAKETAKDVGKKAAKQSAKATAKETTKQVTKGAAKGVAKVSTTVGTSVASSAVVTPVGGAALGIGAGEAVGAKLDQIDRKMMMRKRKLTFFFDRLKTQEKQKDSLVKVIRDTIRIKYEWMVKKVVTSVGLWIGAVLLLILLVSSLVGGILALIYNSPFALFFPPLNEGDTILTITRGYEQAFNQEVQRLATEHTGYDNGEVIYSSYEGISSVPSNYYDVLAVYMVQHGVEQMATVVTDASKQQLREVFDDMASYTTTVKQDVTITVNEEGEETETVTRTLQVRVSLKSYHQMTARYGFDSKRVEALQEMMKPENLALIGYTGGSGTGGGFQGSLSLGDLSATVADIDNEQVKQAVSFALSKVGYPYSQAYRHSGSHYDCSSLMYYAYKAAGVDISYGGATTAAAECKGLDMAGKSVPLNQLQPGDLIFYSYTNNGRYKNISHVALYVGGGKVVEAANTQLGVIYRNMVGVNSIVGVGRPTL